MHFYLESLSLATQAPIEIIDLSEQVRQACARYPLQQGWVTITSAHTTGFIALNEREPKLQQDMLDFLTRLAPPAQAHYRHDLDPIDGRPNTHSHLIGLFMNASATIIVADGQLLLGDWQSVFFIELDGPRPHRQVRLQIAGQL
ncbi:secondary thiamine-phosphate synthase enzyme [Allochromatium warmingii]|uniref:Secondary thiamine-phosphate synthase enzyme n=1 Tax=Allochromatium warmingii TaxID=61595 RepID=A0A1H3FKR6_ALLWA|nr:secondary thiamine-phosphate synthase enzyme YjbQ [Allochromatium warmingii]SDX91693.1 secondary thiamine-phosphate synthase enzyme [Allochromatium warmingii]